MHKAGRYTAALLLIGVGTAVIADKTTGTSWTPQLAEWWPVLFITLGLEYILYNRKGAEQPIRLDVGGLIFSVLLSAVVIAGTQSPELFRNWTGFRLAESFGQGTGTNKMDKETVRIPLQAELETLRIENRLGSVKLEQGSAGSQVEATLSVHLKESDEEARQIAEASRLEYHAADKVLVLKTIGEEEGGLVWLQNKPRLDLTVTVPADHPLNVELALENGSIEAEELPLRQWMRGETTNGSVTLTSLKGDLQLKTSNGRMEAGNTQGNLNLQSTNGRIDVKGHSGNAVLRTTNGKLSAESITGSLEAATTNGTITVEGVTQGFMARTTNGTVEASSPEVGGNWEVRTSNGKVELEFPAQGDYRVESEGRHSRVESELPLTVQEDMVQGSIGTGKHTVRIETDGSVTLKEAH
ncbi:hypothetical protein PM3016_920 [Paenibacillus mucilaginosus 3016]|uniref:DUF4097 domain-containing protein n=1 Tax=Paenibacillus mucilaginosus 3016 TaxID=1116391 RepID=H6NBR3_9BACL|nr:DUF4097 family beta strand repeat-containing protein [Paenibacillus mucilaginosus]AFC27864.1 hypothetical protein PM3016_920 [Paenibacillus mucilaginosus 3016]